MERIKQLKYISLKGVNVRIEIFLLEKKGIKTFRLTTKRLIDFKNRSISETDNFYTVETFKFIHEMSTLFFMDSEVSNKILLKELNNIKHAKANSNLNIKQP